MHWSCYSNSLKKKISIKIIPPHRGKNFLKIIFLSNINYDDPAELDIIVPYFAKKLKDITQYIVSKRQDVKTTVIQNAHKGSCLLYTSPSPRDGLLSRMPSSA